MDSKMEIIKNKIWEITEKTERIDEISKIISSKDSKINQHNHVLVN